MNKDKFFSACVVKTEEYTLGDQKVTLKGLTLRQRKKVTESGEDQDVLLLIAGCEELDDGDIEKVKDISADIIDDMTTIIMRLSGFGEEKKD